MPLAPRKCPGEPLTLRKLGRYAIDYPGAPNLQVTLRDPRQEGASSAESAVPSSPPGHSRSPRRD